MNKRRRNKQLKKLGIPTEKELKRDSWSLDYSIAQFTLPRLKYLSKHLDGYPASFSDCSEWEEVLQKMIIAFEYMLDEDNWWLDNSKYDYTKYMNHITFKDEEGRICSTFEPTNKEKYETIRAAHMAELARRNSVIDEGLELFGKYFRKLWT